MSLARLVIFAAVSIGASGCVTIADVNSALARLDRTWQLEYQRTEDEFRYRVIETDPVTAFEIVRRAFLDLGMPVQTISIPEGTIIAQNNAPAPLSMDEWREIIRIEEPRAKEIGGWFMTMNQDPRDTIVTLQATLRPFNNKTFVLIDYRLDQPKMRARGINGSRFAPPYAVQLGSQKFWEAVEKRLTEVRAPALRKRTPQEIQERPA